MGISNDAYLFYGVCFDVEGYSKLWRYDECAYYDDGEDEELMPDWEKRYSALTGRSHESSQCEIDWHCHHEYPMPFVAIAKSTVVASRGFPAIIESLKDDPEWPALIKKFCEDMRIIAKPDGEPGWRMVSVVS